MTQPPDLYHPVDTTPPDGHITADVVQYGTALVSLHTLCEHLDGDAVRALAFGDLDGKVLDRIARKCFRSYDYDEVEVHDTAFDGVSLPLDEPTYGDLVEWARGKVELVPLPGQLTLGAS